MAVVRWPHAFTGLVATRLRFRFGSEVVRTGRRTTRFAISSRAAGQFPEIDHHGTPAAHPGAGGGSLGGDHPHSRPSQRPQWRAVRVARGEGQARLVGDGTCLSHEQPDHVGNRHFDQVAGANPCHAHPPASSLLPIHGRGKSLANPVNVRGHRSDNSTCPKPCARDDAEDRRHPTPHGPAQVDPPHAAARAAVRRAALDHAVAGGDALQAAGPGAVGTEIHIADRQVLQVERQRRRRRGPARRGESTPLQRSANGGQEIRPSANVAPVTFMGACNPVGRPARMRGKRIGGRSEGEAHP